MILRSGWTGLGEAGPLGGRGDLARDGPRGVAPVWRGRRGLLALRIYPGQRDALAEPDDGGRLRALSMIAGIYNLLWAVVVVLMIARPGAYP
ncbi:hypothetical protein [Streptosporangium sp. NPDC002524]|uniref:hypothetical protein n=1 Tax=Streptosporangium sp. NPDC002524 TaxID=3154537 RepID=UPI003326354A